MRTLITNIGFLTQVEESDISCRKGAEMKHLPVLENAFLLMEDGKYLDYGTMADAPERADEMIDADGGAVLPGWTDSHTHLVYAGSRELEYRDKILGLTYEQIAANGGGILNSAKRLQQTSEAELLDQAWARLQEIRSFGTCAVEIKSGYGLTVADELKMLRVARTLKEQGDLTVKTTLLGAHALPVEFKQNRSAYIDSVVDQMIPQAAAEGLADYCDVFCDRGFFTVEETDRILDAGLKYGLKPKIHANELDYSGGIQVGVKHGAISVDHLEFTGAEEMDVLLHSNTMPTLLPSTAFFLGLHYPPARKMIDAGLPVSLATDYNPGSSPSGNFPFILSLACIQMRMLPEEAINAATINAAYALELQNQLGKIKKGLPANCFITKKIPSLSYLPYSFGSNLIKRVITHKI
jgi:imidazolonepropionase